MSEVQFEEKSVNKSFFVGILLILVVIFAYTFLVAPISENVAILKSSVDEKKAIVSVLNADIKAIKDAKLQLGESSEVERSNILKMIPVGPNQDDVIRTITTQSQKHDVLMNSLSFSNVPSKKVGVGVLKVNASFESAYADLPVFLKDLEQASRLLKVDSLNVQVSRLALAGERVNFSLTMEAYYQK